MSEQNPLEEAMTEQIAALLREAVAGRAQDAPQKPESAVAAVTLAEVAARLRLDAAREGGLDAADARALQSLLVLRERALPPRLTPRAVADYLASLGLASSPRFCEAFAEAAIFLRMGRQQTAQLAAAKNQVAGGLS